MASLPVALIVPEAMQRKPDAPYTKILVEAGFEIRYPRNPTFPRGIGGEGETIHELQGIHAVLAGGGEHYTAEALSALPELRVIARSGVGYDRVDVDAATRQGIAVCITPTANHEAVAEHALALLLALAKNVVHNDQLVRSGGWRTTINRPLRGRTLGLVGLGRIGRSLAVRARALGMGVVTFETRPDTPFVERHQIEVVSFERLLDVSDVVSVHCPLCDETRGLFDAKAFARMKHGSLFLNTARGGVVVESDLLEALRSGHLGGAGLDVYQVEPTTADNPLFRLDNVVLSPHIASGDTLAMENMGIEAARCMARLLHNDWPEGAVVNDELRDTWQWPTQ
ncbi:MAG: lactate dehydrogenase [Planctomycetes bacterium]|nr:lactate dehydrogenase [Planctomycetota bacterium]